MEQYVQQVAVRKDQDCNFFIFDGGTDLGPLGVICSASEVERYTKRPTYSPPVLILLKSAETTFVFTCSGV